MDRKFLIAILGIAGNPDRADHFALRVADQHAAAFGENLFAACRDQIAHEDRPLLGALVYQLRTAPERQSRVGFTEGHFEADHGRSVFLLERLYLATGLDDD